MIVLILVAILWIAVLLPTVLSKLSERRSASSIGRFHQRLDLLQRTGPKLVEPAHRLTGTESARPVPIASLAPINPRPLRPNLTLVAGAIDVRGNDNDNRDDPAVVEEERVELHLAPAWDEVATPELFIATPDLVARERRKLARRRRRHVFGTLCALVALTAMMGLAHPLRGAWVASGVFLVLLVGFVGLAVYGQRVEAERRHLDGLVRHEPSEEEAETRSPSIRYLSEDELAYYHDTPTDDYDYEDGDGRLAIQA